MAQNTGPPIYLPEFPKNAFGLKRGSILRAKVSFEIEFLEIEISQGEEIALGFDGEDVCYRNMIWEIRELEEQIRQGIWRITGEYIDLSNRKKLIAFIEEIEKRPAFIQ